MQDAPPSDAQTLSLWSAAIGFVVGILSSAAVAVPLYFRQKRDAAAAERRLMRLLEEQLGPSSTVMSTMSVISDRQEEMFARFGDLQETVERLAEEPASRVAVRNPFTAAARASALVRAERLLKSEPIEPTLSSSRVRELHAKLFPPGYELGGQLRDGTVWVGPQGGGPDVAVFIPPEAAVVPAELEELLSDWNRSLVTLGGVSQEEQARAIAAFHHRFVSLHPFWDGNGVLGRLIASLQFRALTRRTPVVQRSTTEYLEALRSSDAGDLSQLTTYFKQLPEAERLRPTR